MNSEGKFSKPNLLKILAIILAIFGRASCLLYLVFEVIYTILHYDLVLISLNDKIIRYIF